MAASDFFNSTVTLWNFLIYPLYGATALIALAALFFVIRDRRCTNATLLTFNAFVLVESVSNVFSIYFLGQLEIIPEAVTVSIAYAADSLIHWLICYLYVQAALEMGALLDKEIMTNNYERL